jgi:anthranilate/para-aminobenzoate synthase component II
LRKAVKAAEQNRQAAMRALAEERQRSLELQVKISRQKEAAAALEEEVRVLKVIIFPGPVEASIDSGILISLCTLVHKEFILAACILCGTSI